MGTIGTYNYSLSECNETQNYILTECEIKLWMSSMWTSCIHLENIALNSDL